MAGAAEHPGDDDQQGQEEEASARRTTPRRAYLGRQYDPAPVREATRSWLAKALVWLLIGTSATLMGTPAAGLLTVEETKTLALAVLAPLIGVTGTALGFYFGGQKDG